MLDSISSVMTTSFTPMTQKIKPHIYLPVLWMFVPHSNALSRMTKNVIFTSMVINSTAHKKKKQYYFMHKTKS